MGRSHYSLQYSRKEPHAASSEAKIKVEQLQSELVKPAGSGGSRIDPDILEGIPMRSLAMLVCKVGLPSELAVQHYPKRPPIPADSPKAIKTPDGRLAIPAFLIHSSLES
jgi:hypothetical protein